MASDTGHTEETSWRRSKRLGHLDLMMRPAKDTCLSGYDLRGIREATLPIHEPTLPIHEPLMNHPVPLLTQTRQEPCPLDKLGRFCALFGPKESGDEAVTKR